MPDEPKKQIAYVVTEGEYSSFCVIGVFLDKTLAEETAKFRGTTNPIEEYVIDEPLPEWRDGRTLWSMWMEPNGTVTSVWRDDTMKVDDESRIEEGKLDPARYRFWIDPVKTMRSIDSIRVRHPLLGMQRVSILAVDADHAVKIAGEKRSQLVAAGLWVAK